MSPTITAAQRAKMQEGRAKAAERRRAEPKDKPRIPLPRAFRPLLAIRKKCLDCCSTANNVRWCTMDGLNSTRCELWPYRFGVRPEVAAAKYGRRLLIPAEMPRANEICSPTGPISGDW